eukprot:gnl/MRDRNA2_/MRDRNA2_29901_c0_seq1.p1 gnl/MRDRNA2_/MRDRNA2_29901_c0~~gnl/MRDRNA2_/MRDRNA2_29901_c0_seq1.p1  ORF type:complete len:147 (+),score=24.11 gnl/MRDRNA2_/MRDRNA2_29901_c0_seq1:139-579(+)
MEDFLETLNHARTEQMFKTHHAAPPPCSSEDLCHQFDASQLHEKYARRQAEEKSRAMRKDQMRAAWGRDEQDECVFHTVEPWERGATRRHPGAGLRHGHADAGQLPHPTKDSEHRLRCGRAQATGTGDHWEDKRLVVPIRRDPARP